MPISSKITRHALVIAMVWASLFGLAGAVWADSPTLIYDLEWNGPGTSQVEECYVEGSCFQYPIDGRISLTLDPTRPYLDNVGSAVLIPPGAPADPGSIFAWQRLNFTVGEYLTDPQSSDLSMRFYPDPVLDTVEPLYELFVDLTDGRTMLTLTGGGSDLSMTPGEIESIAFSVSGKLVPEPSTALLVTFALVGLIANRRRR